MRSKSDRQPLWLRRLSHRMLMVVAWLGLGLLSSLRSAARGRGTVHPTRRDDALAPRSLCQESAGEPRRRGGAPAVQWSCGRVAGGLVLDVSMGMCIIVAVCVNKGTNYLDLSITPPGGGSNPNSKQPPTQPTSSSSATVESAHDQQAQPKPAPRAPTRSTAAAAAAGHECGGADPFC